MRRIRVLNVIGSVGRGGTERLMYDLLSRLDGEIFDLEVWSVGMPRTEAELRRFEAAGIRTDVMTVDGSRWSELFGHAYRTIKQRRFDVVHTHHWAANNWMRAAAILAGVPVVMTYEHGFTRETWRRHLLWMVLNLRTYRNVVVSEAVKNTQYRGRLGCTPKVSIITNGVDLGRFTFTTDQETLMAKERLCLLARQPVVGVVGRFVPCKRHGLFVEACSFVLKKTPEAQFVIAGEGLEEQNLRSLLNRIGLESKVRLLGWRSDIEEVYKAMDVFVMTSDEMEGFGLASVEAMACGKPVVAVDVPVNAEVITTECGILVAPDPESLAQGVGHLLENPGLARRMGVLGRKRAEERFDIARAAAMLSSLYEEAVKSKGIKLNREVDTCQRYT